MAVRESDRGRAVDEVLGRGGQHEVLAPHLAARLEGARERESAREMSANESESGREMSVNESERAREERKRVGGWAVLI